MKTKEQKSKIIEKVKQLLEQSNGVAVAGYQGTTMPQFNAVRDKMRPLGTKFMVVKNTLAAIAAKGTPYEQCLADLKGPIAIAFLGEDASSPLKALFEFAKSNQNCKIQFGMIDAKPLDTNSLKAYSELPTKNEIRAMLLGTLNAPAQQLLGLFNAVPREFVGVLKAYEDKLGAQQPEQAA